MIGAVGGVMEVCLMQPMVAFKNALQEGRPLPKTPIQMYRGLLVSRAVEV
jgi:solute carrier family 25 citrate transporter 1